MSGSKPCDPSVTSNVAPAAHTACDAPSQRAPPLPVRSHSDRRSGAGTSHAEMGGGPPHAAAHAVPHGGGGSSSPGTTHAAASVASQGHAHAATRRSGSGGATRSSGQDRGDRATRSSGHDRGDGGTDGGASSSQHNHSHREPPPVPPRRPSVHVRQLHQELGLMSTSSSGNAAAQQHGGAAVAAKKAKAAVGAGASSVVAAGRHMGKWLWSNSEGIRAKVSSGTTSLTSAIVGGNAGSDAGAAGSSGGDVAETGGTTHAGAGSGAGAGAGRSAYGKAGKAPVVGPVLANTVTHDAKVTYNAKAARFEGLPDGWESSNQQFGLPLAACPKNAAVGYDKAVPAVVVLLAQQLLDAGGPTTQGIFRKAASKSLVDATKLEINEGRYVGCDDVHVLATLLKVWFRELPANLLDSVNEQTMVQVLDGGDAAVAAFMSDWEPAHANLMRWLLDYLAQFVVLQRQNLMTSENMAIVWAPNLVTLDAVADPMQAIVRSRMVCKFLRQLLLWRLATELDFTESK